MKTNKIYLFNIWRLKAQKWFHLLIGVLWLIFPEMGWARFETRHLRPGPYLLEDGN